MTDNKPANERWPHLYAIGRYKGLLRRYAMSGHTEITQLLDAIEGHLIAQQSQIDQLAGFKQGVLEAQEQVRLPDAERLNGVHPHA